MTRGESTAPIKIGDIVADRYEVRRELGRGGMGVVYLCHDRVSGDRVALKCVFFDRSPSRAKDAIWFQQEARALAVLDHPAIVRARDFGVLPDGNPYLTMDALMGRSIHVWKYLGRIPWPAIWAIVDQTLAGLAHAHARGVIHGDLKPSNIMVDPAGGKDTPRAYMLDLGLAWLLGPEQDPRLESGPKEAPTLPFGLGTPGWMAPEQIRNAAPHIGPPTDLYALGSILFELLMRREVFDGKSTELLRKHRDEPLPEFELPPSVPAGVGDFTRRLLAKKPWDRYRFAADARAAWDAFKPEDPIRWNAPNVRLGDEDEDPALSPAPPPATAPQSYRTLSVAPGILTFRPTPLVGRDAERATLWSHATAVASGDAPTRRLALLRGEAGVGKSRLAEWVCEQVHEAGLMMPLRGRYRRVPGPIEGMRGAILWHYHLVGAPRADVEQALLNEWEVPSSDENGRTWVAAAAEWLRPTALDEEDKLGPSGKRFFLDRPELRWVVIRHVLDRIARDGRALTIWLDDVHFASRSTFQALAELKEHTSDLRFLLICTVRDEAVAGDEEKSARIAALARSYHTTALTLRPMDENDTRALLRAAIPLAPDVERAVAERSHGNPLFALQTVHAWAGGGQLSLRGREYSVPEEALQAKVETTAELWDERIRAIPVGLRRAAPAAAALGEVIHLDVLKHLLRELGLDDVAAVSALQRAEILVIEGGTRLRWPHALLSEHLTERLRASPNAAEIYRLAADALAIHPDSNTRRIVRQRTQNLILAGQPDAAADLLLGYVARAWVRVRDVGSTRNDLALIEKVATGKHRAHYLRWRAEVERHAGKLADARAHAEDARRAFETLGDEENEAHCLRLLAHIASDQGAPTLGRLEVGLARAKFEALGNARGIAECDVVLGELEYLLGDHENARVHLSAAARACRELGNELGVAQCLILQSLAAQAAGQLVASRDLLREARLIFDSLGYQLGLAQVDMALAHVDHRNGDFGSAYDLGLRCRDRFRVLENPRGEAAAERLLGMAAMDMDDIANAKIHAFATYRLYDDALSDSWGRAEGATLLAQVALAERHLDEADKQLAVALAVPLDEAEPQQHRKLTAAWLALERGQTKEAIASLEAARAAFPDHRRTGDHTVPLLRRMQARAKGTPLAAPIEAWIVAAENDAATRTPLPISTDFTRR